MFEISVKFPKVKRKKKNGKIKVKLILAGRGDCRFDNVTIISENLYIESIESDSYCGNNKPPLLKSISSLQIIFMTDKYAQRSGFQFKYFLNSKFLASFHIDYEDR